MKGSFIPDDPELPEKYKIPRVSYSSLRIPIFSYEIDLSIFYHDLVDVYVLEMFADRSSNCCVIFIEKNVWGLCIPCFNVVEPKMICLRQCIPEIRIKNLRTPLLFRPDHAQGLLGDAQIGCNMAERGPQ